MIQQATLNDNPCCIVGDLNVITSVEEKHGGVPYNMRKSIDFIAVIAACGLLDISFSGQNFTWSKKRGINQRIWKRLDRAMVNDSWLEKMPQTTITHLSSTRSNHFLFLWKRFPHLLITSSISYFSIIGCTTLNSWK